jgi:hypothetical protein
MPETRIVLLTSSIDFFAYDFPMRQPNPNQFITEDTGDTESKAFLRGELKQTLKLNHKGREEDFYQPHPPSHPLRPS